MKIKYLFILTLIMTIVLLSCDTTDPPYITRPTSEAAGINLGNALEAPEEGDWGVTLEEDYFSIISDAGFKYLRIPIRWSEHALGTSPYTIDSTFMDRVTWAVDLALANNLITIINIHHYEEIMSDPDGHKDRFLGFWEQIADEFKDYPGDLYLEILNEPNDQLTPTIWNEYLADALTVIRVTNPERTVVIGTANWGGIGGLNILEIPTYEEDPNIIVTFHYYSPFEFTHQGAGWVEGSDAWLGTTWPETSQDEQDVRDDLDEAADWGLDNNRTMFMGEFGAYSQADMESRVLWTDFVTREAEARGIFWTYWEFCSGFGAYDADADQWTIELLDALIPPESE